MQCAAPLWNGSIFRKSETPSLFFITINTFSGKNNQVTGLQSIDNTEVPGKLKTWCFQFGLLAWALWPLSGSQAPVSKAQKLEILVTAYIKKVA